MRAIIVRLLLFTALVAITHVTLIGLAATVSPSLKATILKYSNVPVGFRRDHIALRFEELHKVRDIDVLFIGSSHSLRTFDPRYFERRGLRAFNLGTSNQTPISTYYLLRRYLTQLKPRLVVVEAYWEILESNADEGTMAIAANRGPGWDTFMMALATRHPKTLNVQWSSLFERLFGTAAAIRLGPAEAYTSGGYLEAWDENTTRAPRRGRYDIAVDEKQVKYLSSTLTLLRDHNARAILVWAPVTAARRDTATNLEEVRRLMTDLSAAHSVPFVDLNDRVGLDDRLDFRDDDHLNQRGVDKLMPVFMRVLQDYRLLDEMAVPSTASTVHGQ
nr:hypothetical protein [uncultured bacterium]